MPTKTRVLWGAVLACACVGASACSGGSSNVSSSAASTTTSITTTTLAPAVTTSVVATSTTVAVPADCAQAIANVEAAIVNAANSVDADPAAQNTAGVPIFTAFAAMAVPCHAQAGTAYSDLIQFLSTQGPVHQPATQKAIKAVVKAFCGGVPPGVTLTPSAKAICAAHK